MITIKLLKHRLKVSIIMSSLITLPGGALFSQNEAGLKRLSIQECLSIAYKNNEQIKTVQIEAEYYKQLKKTATELPKTALMYTQGQFNSIYPYDNIFSITQTFPFPTLLKAQSTLGKAQINGAEIKTEAVKASLDLQVKEAYYMLEHLIEEGELLHKEDSIYELFLKIAEEKKSKTNKNELQEVTTMTQAHFIQSAYNDLQQQINDYKIKLQYLLRINEMPEITILRRDERILVPDTNGKTTFNQPHLRYLKEQIAINKQTKTVEQQKGIPDIVVGYFNQSIYGPANIYGDDYFLTRSNRLQGFQVGLTLPLYYLPHKARVKAMDIKVEQSKEEYTLLEKDMMMQFKQAFNKYEMTKKNLDYYRDNILENTKEMVTQALGAYHNKEISFIEYLAVISKSFEMARHYLNLILDNNMAVIQIDYLLADKTN